MSAVDFLERVGKSRKENPQKLTQLSSRSHPRQLVGKRTAQKDITFATSVLSLEVSGSASLYLVARSTRVKANLNVLFIILLILTVPYGKNNKSAWCTPFSADTSNLGLIMF